MVNRKDFDPSPNVDSAVVRLIRNNKEGLIKNREVFNKLIKDSFSMKRKNIKNNLRNYDLKNIEQILFKYDLSLSDRAENIPLEAFIEIANNIH